MHRGIIATFIYDKAAFLEWKTGENDLYRGLIGETIKEILIVTTA